MIYKIIGNLDCRVIKFVVFFLCVYIFSVYMCSIIAKVLVVVVY